MIALGNFLLAVAELLSIVCTVFFWIMIARAILSFVSPDPSNQLVQIIYNMTEPIIAWTRQWVRPIGVFDLAFIVVLLAVGFFQTFLVGALQDYGQQLRLAGNSAVL